MLCTRRLVHLPLRTFLAHLVALSLSAHAGGVRAGQLVVAPPLPHTSALG